MENNSTVEESVKGLSTRFFKWDQKFITSANQILPFLGVFVLHLKLTTFETSKLVGSMDEYMAFLIDPIPFFTDNNAAESFFTNKVAPSLSFLSSQTLQTLNRDIFTYLFRCFKIGVDILNRSEQRRLPVIVIDIYLTRQVGESVDHVGRQKLSYISTFEDIVKAVFEHICSKSSLSLARRNAHVKNLGLLRVCPLVKEKKSRYTTAEECIICFDRYNVGDLLLEGPCSHRFHRACLLDWLPKSCPMCRRSCARDLVI